MNPWSVISASLLLMLPAGTTTGQDQGAAIESQFVKSWRRAASEPAAAIGVWKAFAKENPGHDLAELARLQIDIHLLRQGGNPGGDPGGDPAEALGFLSIADHEKPSPLRRLIRDAGRGLAARIHMQRLAEILQTHYRRRVEYPLKLDELVVEGIASADELIDPFGRPYEYEARARALLPDLPRQIYRLRCASIDADHGELSAALERADEPIRDMRVSRLEGYDDRALVRARRPDGAPGKVRVWRIGREVSGLVLWSVYDGWVLVAREQFPKLLMMAPRKREATEGQRGRAEPA